MINGKMSDDEGNFLVHGNVADNAFLKFSFIGFETQIVYTKK